VFLGGGQSRARQSQSTSVGLIKKGEFLLVTNTFKREKPIVMSIIVKYSSECQGRSTLFKSNLDKRIFKNRFGVY